MASKEVRVLTSKIKIGEAQYKLLVRSVLRQFSSNKGTEQKMEEPEKVASQSSNSKNPKADEGVVDKKRHINEAH